ncbi:histidine kinase [Aureisphaera galaxeae]|uniref:sensor histidine kinase n=1 Tax=Aureisphaera galaxeae TaxID=1538023 RepID=UPI002350042E|nr:histidine kinase [Aureisphaera galaxeae]MDC8002853.1 histidine kinase [Aureisphaera galaxeae]
MKVKILDKILIKYLLLFYGVAFGLSALSGIIGKLQGIAFKTYGWGGLIFNTTFRYTSKLLFVVLALLLVRYLQERKNISEWVAMALHGLFGVTLTFYSVTTQVIVGNLVYGFDDPVTWEYIYPRAIMGTDYNFFLYFCSVAIVYAYYYFKKQRKYELQESQLKTQLLDSKIRSLQSQLQPHFLFNALNDIAALVDQSPEKAQDSIADLSEMLRKTLQLKDTKFISLAEELELLRKYVEIERIRYDSKLRVNEHIAKDSLAEKVPPLLLQPIVENSLKHGFSYDHDSLTVDLNIRSQNGKLMITVENDGKPLSQDRDHFGIGLSNILSRLDTLYEGDFVFEMQNREGEKGVQTSIEIPIN